VDAPPEPDDVVRFTVRVIPEKVTNFSVKVGSRQLM
jgi:hypothetical protein